MDGDSLGVLKFVRGQVTRMSLILNLSLAESVSNNLGRHSMCLSLE